MKHIAVVVVSVLVFALAGVALWRWAGDEWAVSRLNAAFNYGLFAGALLAAALLLEQVSEAQRNRQDALRPVVVVLEPAWCGDVAEIMLHNVGPGPALSVTIQAWISQDGSIPSDGAEQLVFLSAERDRVGQTEPGVHTPPFALRAGGKARVTLTGDDGYLAGDDGDRIYYRINYLDAFDNAFSEPRSGGLGRVWIEMGQAPHYGVTHLD